MRRAVERRAEPMPLLPSLSTPASWRLLDMAYANQSALWAFMAVCITIGSFAFASMGDLRTAAWALFGIGVALGRIVDWHGYKARRAAGRLLSAQRRFMILATMNGLYWGVANTVLLLSPNTLLQFCIINVETAVVSLTVARMNPMGAAIKIQVIVSTVPLIACCLLTGDIHLQAYGALAVLYLFSVISVIDDLHAKTVRLVVSDEHNAALLRQGAETNAQLQAANRRLEEIATTDGLTGIANRRRFDETMRKEWDRAARSGTGLAVLLIDIDKFKSYNDTFGHPAGDACLCGLARTLAGALRGPSDLAARYGGEEFAVVLPDADRFGTINVAERLRAAVEAMALPGPSGSPMTVSIGAAICQPQAQGEDAADGISALIAEADCYLYEAKRSGRNRVAAGAALPSGLARMLPEGGFG